ncbi:NADPH-dependent F420 reductase [Nocardioides sp. LMS-CY]|uniref:NADPH-dependent F420 reductase n=1 Tax=Nocardioides sp. (strain LMS-CY) TaxID=2840457 RepID=UPI001BFFF597|nr:NADPH-dependent F420 reductase [Nocardioides sp. LMS-CY]QWF23181.1 NADPH-dependent F420 reductase [Nocardioides sp. LMS-CY]
MSIPLRERTIGVLGGTGPQGRGLARRFATAGLTVLLGSRDAARAARTAIEMAADLGLGETGRLCGADNLAVAEASDIVVVAVPWSGHEATLAEVAPALSGKIVVDCVNPLAFRRGCVTAAPVPEGSAAQQAARLLPDASVVGAFHNVSAVLLADPEVQEVDTDVLVLGDDADAVMAVQQLAETIPGVRGVLAGSLDNAAQVEALTANLITINRRYSCHSGIRISGLPGAASG